MEEQLQAQAAELIALRELVQQQAQQMQQQQQVHNMLTTQVTAKRESHEGIMDTKMLQKVKQFDGTRKGWKTWEFQWRAFLMAQDRRFRPLLQRVDGDEDVMNNTLGPEMEPLSNQLYYMLVLAMPDESPGETILRNAPEGEGAEAWRRLLREYAPTEPGNVVSQFRKVVSTVFPPGADIVVEIGKLDLEISRYEKIAGEVVSPNITRGILLGALANEPELQRHLFRHMRTLATYNDVKAEVISTLAASRSVGDDPMEIGALKGVKGKKTKKK